MIVRRLDIDIADAGALLFALAQSEPHMIDCCNWPKVSSYVPKVVFRAFHTGEDLVLRFDVLEKCTAARVTEFGGNVCKDSCVEFFIDPDGKGERYYNFESSCIGVMHNTYHELPSFKIPASNDVYESIPVYPSVGYAPFEEIVAGEHHCCHHGEQEGEEHHCCHHGEQEGEEHHCCCHHQPSENAANYWHITFVIPISALFHDKFKSWAELKNARCNFYKCGDGLSMPHYLSWAPIGTESPKFHAPEFFRDVEFEL